MFFRQIVNQHDVGRPGSPHEVPLHFQRQTGAVPHEVLRPEPVDLEVLDDRNRCLHPRLLQDPQNGYVIINRL